MLWIKSQRFEQAAQQVTLEDYQYEVEHAAERIARLERSIDAAVETLPVKMRAVVEVSKYGSILEAIDRLNQEWTQAALRVQRHGFEEKQNL